MRVRLATAVVLALVLSACGASGPDSESSFQGEQQQVAKVVDELASAGARGDAEKICTEILAKRLVAEVKAAGGDCETEMDRAISDASDYDLQVRSIKISGPNATAQVRQGADGEVATFSFVKEGGAWKASALGN